jgi:hypothetical protein
MASTASAAATAAAAASRAPPAPITTLDGLIAALLAERDADVYNARMNAVGAVIYEVHWLGRAEKVALIRELLAGRDVKARSEKLQKVMVQGLMLAAQYQALQQREVEDACMGEGRDDEDETGEVMVAPRDVVDGFDRELVAKTIEELKAKDAAARQQRAGSMADPAATARGVEEVNALLVASGVPEEKVEQVSHCLRAGLLRGHYKEAVVPANNQEEDEEEDDNADAMDEGKDKGKGKKGKKGKPKMKLDLDYVVWRGRCEAGAHGWDIDPCCPPEERTEMVARIRDLLFQPDEGGDYEDYSYSATVECPECEYRVYLDSLCAGRPSESNGGGKGFNHCRECPGFGCCIGDIREAHCRACGEHYFAGTGGMFACSCVELKQTLARARKGHKGALASLYHRAGNEEDEDGAAAEAGAGEGGECCVM